MDGNAAHDRGRDAHHNMISWWFLYTRMQGRECAAYTPLRQLLLRVHDELGRAGEVLVGSVLRCMQVRGPGIDPDRLHTLIMEDMVHHGMLTHVQIGSEVW